MQKVSIKAISLWLIRLMALMAVLFTLALGLLYVYLQRDPQHLIDEWLGPIAAKTGLKFEVGSVNVTLLPLPALAVSDVRISGPNMDLTLAWAQARPSFLELLQGNFFPGTILLLRGNLRCVTNLPLASPTDLLKVLEAQLGGPDANIIIPGNFLLNVDQLDVEIKGAAESALHLSNLQTELNVEENGNITGTAALSALRLLESDRKLIGSLERFHIQGSANILTFLHSPMHFESAGHARWVGVIEPTRIAMELQDVREGWRGRLSVDGNLDLERASVPFSLATAMVMPRNGTQITLPDLHWSLGDDSGTSTLEFVLPAADREWLLRGNFSAHRLGLTQWLGFARNLAPGLQLAMDNITSASLNFSLTSRSLKATEITATSCGTTFTGEGGVENFAKPVVALNLQAPKVNLGVALPEAAANIPEAPFFPHPPLTPMPGEPLKPGETGIGYDIRLAAALLLYGPLKIQKASLRIYPGKMDKSGLEDVLLDAKAQFYGGTISGACILGADKSLPLHISVKSSPVNGESLSKDMPILPFRQGKWEASAVITSRGKELAKFLANLAGDITVTATNAAFAATGPQNVFQKLKTSVKVRSAAWVRNYFTMDGIWKGSAETQKGEGSGSADGKMSFGTDGVTFRQLPANVICKLNGTPLSQPPGIKISGKFSGQTDSGIFELAQGVIELPGLTVQTSSKINAAKFTATGTASTQVKDLNSALRKLGFKDGSLPQQFNQLKAASSYTVTTDSVKLSNLKGNLGPVSMEGTLVAALPKGRPTLEMDLTLGELPPFTSKSSTKTPSWDFPFMREFDARGRLKIRSLRLLELHFLNISIPFNLEKGQLSVTKSQANFYGAPLEASGHADFRDGLVFDTDLRVNAFDLAKAAQDQKLGIKLFGDASFNAQTKGALKGNASITSNLNGKWQFAIARGGWQTLDKKGQPKGNPIYYKTASASGTLQKGMVRSNDFWLTGPTLTLNGGGWLNLVQQDLKCEFHVSMKGLPDFPLTISGPIKNIKTSIGAGKFILNAVGEVASGFVDALGGVLKGAWNIFKR